MAKARKSINLFNDKEIRPYKTVFNITNEEDLLVWWEYHLETSLEKYSESIHFIHTLYRACFKLLEQGYIFDIIFEKSSKNVYWTLWGKEDLSCFDINCNSCETVEHIFEKERISFQLNTLQTKLQKPSINIKKASKELTVYNFLEDEDRTQIVEINEELNEELIYLEGKGFSEKSIDKIQQLLSVYSLTLASYVEIHHIKSSIDELSYFMNENKANLIVLDKSYVSLFEGLIVNLHKWYEALFINGADSAEAFKDSIAADIEIIKVMTIQNQEQEDEEGDMEFF